MLFISKKDTGLVSLFIVLLKLKTKIAISKENDSGSKGIRNEELMSLDIACFSYHS